MTTTSNAKKNAVGKVVLHNAPASTTNLFAGGGNFNKDEKAPLSQVEGKPKQKGTDEAKAFGVGTT